MSEIYLMIDVIDVDFKKWIEMVKNNLEQIPEVVETRYGEEGCDILVKISSKSETELSKTIDNDIRAVDGVWRVRIGSVFKKGHKSVEYTEC